jgi:hypothetical protein
MLAELALAFPDTTIIAGHAGVYTQECFEVQYSSRVFEHMVEPLWRQNLGLLLEVDNLYGDLTKFGMDFPWRSRDPLFRFKTFKRVVEGLSKGAKKRLVKKLFPGSDFPNFYFADWQQNACLRGTQYLAASTIDYQHRCLDEVFGRLYSRESNLLAFYSLIEAYVLDSHSSSTCVSVLSDSVKPSFR